MKHKKTNPRWVAASF